VALHVIVDPALYLVTHQLAFARTDLLELPPKLSFDVDSCPDISFRHDDLCYVCMLCLIGFIVNG